MSHRTSRWLLAVAATFVTSSFGFGQDPIPIGFSPSPYGQMPYGATPYGSPPPYAMPQYPMQQAQYAMPRQPQYAMPQYPPPQYGMPPYPMPQYPPQAQPQQQGVVTTALRSMHTHHAPVAAAPTCSGECASPGCKKAGCCFCFNICALNHGPTVPLFDGSHLKSCLGTGCFGSMFPHHFGIAHRPGPTAIDSLPTHPYARGPRDYFMFYDNLEAERSRDLRPALIP